MDKPGGITDLARGSFLINGSQEFLTLEMNKILLKGLTSHTGGRVLTKDDPLFEDSGKRTKQFIPVWPYTFLLAVVLFLIDVAVRRIVKPVIFFSSFVILF
jgi:hypothetical protein